MLFFFFKQKTAYEVLRSLVGSEMCIRDRYAVLQRLAEDDGFVVRRLGFQESPEGLTLTYMKTYRPVFTALGFEYGGDVAAARSVGLRFSLKAEENPQRPPREHHLRIALGGIGGAM